MSVLRLACSALYHTMAVTAYDLHAQHYVCALTCMLSTMLQNVCASTWMLSTMSHCRAVTSHKFIFCSFFQSWKRRWVVIHSELSPMHSFIGYGKTERDWLVNSQSISKCFLGEFKLSRLEVKGYDNVLQLSFKMFAVQLAFDSMTKMDQWYNILQKVSGRTRGGEGRGRGQCGNERKLNTIIMWCTTLAQLYTLGYTANYPWCTYPSLVLCVPSAKCTALPPLHHKGNKQRLCLCKNTLW